MIHRPLNPSLLVLGLLLGCGAAQGPGATDLRSITEQRAIEIIHEAATDSGATAAGTIMVQLQEGEFEVDVRIEGSEFGLEWISAQDRADSPSLPEMPPSGQLQIVNGQDGVQVLMLDSRAYRYDPDRGRVQGGATSVGDAEARLRRDVRDFLVYAGLAH